MTHTQAAGPADLTEVRGYGLALNRMYDPDTHMWVQPLGDARARIGMDPLGVETSGTLAQLSFLPVGTELARGRPFGQLEAAKFLGPLVSPMSGTLLASNDMVAADPALTERVPFGAGWLVELAPSDPGEYANLLREPGEISSWFADKVDEYRLKGVIAE